MTENLTTLPIAGVVPRLAAMVYDALLLFALLCMATLLAVLVTGQIDTTIPEASSTVMHKADPLVSGWKFQLYLLAVAMGFYCVFWRKNGQTLGMQAWRIQIQTAEGGTPGWGQCIVRCVAAIVSFAFAGLGYWSIWLDKENRSWHDRLSRTRVVRLPKRSSVKRQASSV
ncbi:MAG: putative RDD family membrane protein YckC [Bacteroidia bacterium]|jgi:uncharacterized RDD family membrane protein YckC